MTREAEHDGTLSDRAAERLLERAAALDAAGSQRVSRLRESALEAGIGAPAFDAALGELRGERVPVAADAPRWVRWGMLGVPDRRTAMAFYWVFCALACVSPLLALLPMIPRVPAIAIALFFTAWFTGGVLWTWRAIRWLDRHGWDALP